MHGESDSRLPGCQLYAAFQAAGTNRLRTLDLLERQGATLDEGLRCYRWDQYGALESRSRAIIWLTIFSFGGGWVGLVSNSQSLASAASRSLLSVVPPYSICLLMVRSSSSFGALHGQGSPFAWLKPIRQGHVVQVVGCAVRWEPPFLFRANACTRLAA